MALIRKKATAKIKREFSAGGVVYKRKLLLNSKSQLLWLVTKSAPSDRYPKSAWRLPKGWLDDKNNGKLPGPLARGVIKAKEEDLRQAALKEVEEEAGIKAKIIAKIGTITFFFKHERQKVLKFVTFYLMEWKSDLFKGYGKETEEVRWLPFESAEKILSYSSENQVLKRAREILKQINN